MNPIKKLDIEMGEQNEKKIIGLCKKYFGLNKLEKTPPNAIFDFVQKDDTLTYIEVKSRRCYKNKYEDTMVGHNKIKWLENNPHHNAYFVFMFEDGNYFYKYNPNDPDCEIRIGGRWDRGKVEKKLYYYIPTHKLKIFM